MKNISEEVLFEALGEIDDELLEEAFSIDNTQKFAELKKSDNRIIIFTPFFMRVTAICVSLAVIVAAVITGKNLNKSKIPVIDNAISSNDKITAQQSSLESGGDSASNSDDSDITSSNITSSDNTQNIFDATSSQNNSSTGDSSNNVNSSDNSSSEKSDNQVDSEFKIKSIDEINFYTAKKILSDKYLLPISNKSPSLQTYTVKLDENQVYYYQIDRDTKITVSMVTYFTVDLKNEKGFLAQKLGGTGLVEVVITANSLDNMITFKKGDKYYSCLWSSASYKTYSDNSLESVTFSTHKYIEGFNLVKNPQQENFQFTVFFEGTKVVKIESERYDYNGTGSQYLPDEITVTDDGCIVMFINEIVTIDQLEGFIFKKSLKESKV